MTTPNQSGSYDMLPLVVRDTVVRGGFGRGAWIGALVGLGIGSMVGLAMPPETGPWAIFSAADHVLLGAFVGTVGGAVIGGFTGVGNKRKKLRQLNRLRH